MLIRLTRTETYIAFVEAESVEEIERQLEEDGAEAEALHEELNDGYDECVTTVTAEGEA